jgi:hypothetical protein
MSTGENGGAEPPLEDYSLLPDLSKFTTHSSVRRYIILILAVS